ncbi:MAG: flagellar hook-basal body complex protein FliE [Thermodesulfobacteriota bacterium]
MKTIGLSSNIQPLTYSRPLVQQTSASEPLAFSDMLKSSIETVNRQQIVADDAVKNLATGRDKDIHHTMIEMEKASVSLQMMMQVRNKMIDAYQEIMRMSV